VDKRLRDERITSLLPKHAITQRADFEGDKKNAPAKIAKLEKELEKIAKHDGIKDVKLHFDEEHNVWEVQYTDGQGAERVINWEMAHTPEYRQMMAKYKQIEEYMQPPFVIERVAKGAQAAAEEEELSDTEKEDRANVEKKTGGKVTKRRAAEAEVVEKTSARELFEYVVSEGKKDYTVQRYKGLGEMTAEQLWETTMNPEIRTLLSVKLEDIAETEAIFSTLMGEDVESRRKFIEDNALDVKNLDI
jgi:DNA gyrase subunit B